MPELPEVETIRRELKPTLTGRRITGVRVLRPSIIGHPSPRAFAARLRGRKITGLGRRAKYLLVNLDDRSMLIFHLRLSGRLFAIASTTPPLRHERQRIILTGRRSLVFVEPRALGRAYLVQASEHPPALRGFFKLGVEPVDRGFDKKYLGSKLGRRSARVKDLLLDQSVAAGVGNIYSDEALHLARIHPFRPGRTLSESEIGRLAQSLRRVIRSGIQSFGSSFSDYFRPDGSSGSYQDQTRVYGREGEPCRRCRTVITVARAGSRRTRFCPRCQK